MVMSRRAVLCAAPALLAATPILATIRAPDEAATGLASLAKDARPIPPEERLARIAKLQRLMGERNIGALIMESGTALDYFTGVQWHRSERTTAAVVPANGEAVLVVPAFEEPSVRETLQVPADVRPWGEPESPFVRIVQALRDRGVAAGPIAFENTTRLFIVDGVLAAGPAYRRVSGEALVRACRLIKSPAELANDITLAALRQVHGEVRPGMTPHDIDALMGAATAALGGATEFALILLNEASAYPHGSHQPQTVRDGSVVLMDCGCAVQGYQSDITRTWVVGEPTARQRKVWSTVKRGQEVALEAARPGTPVGAIDDAVRAYYEREGWGPGYRLPGLSHRTGHGIGLDGRWSPACAFRTSPASTVQANSGSGSKTAGI
jgi:Xaa-Pro dipeptidase